MHVVIPFSRNHLQKELIKLYGRLNVILHPIQCESLEWGKDWIQPLMYNEKEKFDMCYEKLNFFKKTFPIEKNEYYAVMGDDDSVEPNVYEEVDKMNEDIVVVSLKRGDDVPLYGSICGTCTLLAREEAMVQWFTGLPQIIMKGYAFKDILYRENTNIGDGCLAEDVKASGYKIAYRPDLFVLHNYYQPGRWERYGDKIFCEN